MLHELIRVWFGWVENWGYWGVFALMALESTVVPVPAEIVIPPAAFWASQGRMSFVGVILAGTSGGYFGSVINYFVSKWVGQPVLLRYGKYALLPRDKLLMAEAFVRRFGAPGVFVARLLPVVRHLISIPAGALRMPFLRFSLATVLGAGLWCAVLAWFGEQVIGGRPELLQSPEEMMKVIKAKLLWFVVAVVVLGVLYTGVMIFKKKSVQVSEPSSA